VVAAPEIRRGVVPGRGFRWKLNETHAKREEIANVTTHCRSKPGDRGQHAGSQAHKLFQSPVYLPSLTHETSKAFGLGVLGDPMTFQTSFIGMLDHVGTHVDAFRHVSPNGATIDEMPLDLFMGKAVCFDLRQIGDLEDITAAHMEEAERKSGVKVNGHIVLLCTGFHACNWGDRQRIVWGNPGLTV